MTTQVKSWARFLHPKIKMHIKIVTCTVLGAIIRILEALDGMPLLLG